MFSFRRLLLNPKGDEGNGDSTPPPSDMTQAAKDFIAQQGDAASAVRELLRDNYTQREKKRLAEAKIPGPDDVVLKGEEARRYKAYQELGKPEDLKRIVSEHTTLATENARYKREKDIARVAAIAKVDADVLATLAGGLEFQVKKGKVKDDKGKEADGDVVLVKDGDAEPVAFGEYVEQHWTKFKASLQPEQATTARPIGTPRRETHTGLPKPDESNPLADLEASLRDTGSGSF